MALLLNPGKTDWTQKNVFSGQTGFDSVERCYFARQFNGEKYGQMRGFDGFYWSDCLDIYWLFFVGWCQSVKYFNYVGFRVLFSLNCYLNSKLCLHRKIWLFRSQFPIQGEFENNLCTFADALNSTLHTANLFTVITNEHKHLFEMLIKFPHI